MKDSNELILGNIIKLTRSSEKKFKQGNFKGAIDDKMKANAILKSKSCDEKIIEKYREELSSLYSSKFDLIFDHKLKIDEIKRNEIVKILEQKSKERLKNLVADLDIAKKIKFIPYTDNVGNILCHSKGQIFCSLKEGSPKSFFESLYCEVPVIATPVGAFPELLDNEFISSDLTYDSIKKVIINWTARPKELLKKQKNLISNIKKNHTIKKASERILKIYES